MTQESQKLIRFKDGALVSRIAEIGNRSNLVLNLVLNDFFRKETSFQTGTTELQSLSYLVTSKLKEHVRSRVIEELYSSKWGVVPKNGKKWPKIDIWTPNFEQNLRNFKNRENTNVLECI